MLSKDDALAIARKLKAEIQQGRGGHSIAWFIHGGKRITHFGIRHGSRRDAGHGHIPKCMRITQAQCKAFCACDLDLEWYVGQLRRLGVID